LIVAGSVGAVDAIRVVERPAYGLTVQVISCIYTSNVVPARAGRRRSARRPEDVWGRWSRKTAAREWSIRRRFSPRCVPGVEQVAGPTVAEGARATSMAPATDFAGLLAGPSPFGYTPAFVARGWPSSSTNGRITARPHGLLGLQMAPEARS
jgi:hypothetical protein